MSHKKNNINPAIHVCLISGQPIPNLLPLLQEKPSKAVFIVSPEMKAQAARLEKVVKNHKIEVAYYYIDSAYDYGEIVAACEKIISGNDAENLVLNVTGGTKIAALAAFQAFFFSDNSNRIIYCDTEHDRLLQLAPKNSQTPLADLITVNDYLACYGLPRSSGGKPPTGAAQRRPYLKKLATLLVQEKDLLPKMNSALEAGSPNKTFANISLNVLGVKGDTLVGILENCRVASRTGSTTINIPSAEDLFFCKGGWLEEFVYDTVQGLAIEGLDLAMNVKVTWDGVGRRSTENEFDVIFNHSNRLHLISCKASNPEKITASGTRATEALNELDSLADRVGGLFGRPMLVSSRRLSEFDRSRAAKMNLYLVDGTEVLQLSQHLRTWLKIP